MEKRTDKVRKEEIDYYYLNRDKMNSQRREIYKKNREERLLRQKEYNLNNKEKVKLIRAKSRLKNKEKNKITSKKYRLNRRLTDPIYKLKGNIKRMIHNSFKLKKIDKSSRTIDILGCTILDFKVYIESKFDTWMTWENKGLYNGDFNYGWDIDHIIPLSSAKSETDIIKLNHYTNLQPLCSKINREIKKTNY